MSLLSEIVKTEAVRLVNAVVSSVTTSAAQVRDTENNLMNYPCHGLYIFNPSLLYTLQYSFDNSTFFSIPMLGSKEVDDHFNELYVKTSSGTISNAEIQVGKKQ